MAQTTPAAATTGGGTFGSGPDTLVLTLAEDAYQGDAQASVTLDGQALTAQPITVTAQQGAGQNDVFTFNGTFGPQAHDLAVSFLNDAFGGTLATDRNLYVNGATFDGTATRPFTATLDAAGTARFTVPPADDPEATPGPVIGGTSGSGPDTLVVTLAEDAYHGDAQASIAIDGRTLTAQPITVTAKQGAGQSEVFTFKGTFGPQAHDLAVSFLNDAYDGTPATDRNLYLLDATYNGIEARPPAADLYSARTARSTIPPAGDPEGAAARVAAAPDPAGAYLSIPPLLGS